jgi:hypothetical protein
MVSRNIVYSQKSRARNEARQETSTSPRVLDLPGLG